MQRLNQSMQPICILNGNLHNLQPLNHQAKIQQKTEKERKMVKEH